MGGTTKKLTKHYYDPKRPGAYGGATALHRGTTSVRRGTTTRPRGTKLTLKKIKEWLSHQDTYTLHKPIRRKFKRRRIVTGGIDQQFQADLVDLQNLRKYNDGFSYLVTCIDVFSKYAWAIPIKTKTGPSIIKAVSSIFKERQPINFQTDKGTEFVNRSFLKFLKEHNVHFFTTENEDIKASIVERFNRTLKEKMWRYFTKTNSLRYLDVLDELVHNYNYSYHRSIKRAPVDVTLRNQEQVWQTLYAPHIVYKNTQRLKEGDRVRIAQAKQNFKKGYTPAWTEELFTVSRLNKTNPITYVLKDDAGEELLGSFYHEEVQKVGDKAVYRIESILQERYTSGRKEYLVKWFGYPASFNSWISDITRYRD